MTEDICPGDELLQNQEAKKEEVPARGQQSQEILGLEGRQARLDSGDRVPAMLSPGEESETNALRHLEEVINGRVIAGTEHVK